MDDLIAYSNDHPGEVTIGGCGVGNEDNVCALLLKNETGEYIAAADRGTLDVSSQLDDTARRFTFAPGEFTQEESEPPPGSADSASGSAASGSDPASDAASGPASASHPASDPAPASGSGEE